MKGWMVTTTNIKNYYYIEFVEENTNHMKLIISYSYTHGKSTHKAKFIKNHKIHKIAISICSTSNPNAKKEGHSLKGNPILHN